MYLVLAKCVGSSIKNLKRVLIPRMKYDQMLQMHFRENDELNIKDSDNLLEVGDWCLVKEMSNQTNIHVNHEVFKVVYKHGNLVDPLTSKISYGYLYKDDYEKFKFKTKDSETTKTEN